METSWIADTVATARGWSPVVQALAGGAVITLLNALGALVVTVWRRPSQKFLDAALGFAAGVMLTAAFTSLILPGVEYGGILPVLAGIVLGAVGLDLADHYIPHVHARRRREGIHRREGVETDRIRAVWLFIIAITLHNAPEGLAVGVAFGAGDFAEGVQLMLAIGIQNFPEGLAVAVSAMNIGLGAYWYAAFVGIRAGLVEIPMAVFGAWAVTVAAPLLPYAMGFAAGAMLYVISDEIVPETHRKGHERLATAGTMAGVVVMLYLDVALG